MDRKKLILIAAAGLLATKPILITAANLEARIDSALDKARADVRTEQPLLVDAAVEGSADELTARMY